MNVAATAGAAVWPIHPYPGLRPFETQEWPIFFGRERMIDEVIDRLAQHRLVLIHGASGSGKSSLVRAGIMPKLARQHQRHGTLWLTCAMRPSGGPLWNLAFELARLEGRADDVERIGEIVGLFNRRDATLATVVASIADLRGKSLCILVDQFEELFRFERETSREEAELFVDLISRTAASDDDASALHVLITMRSEFLGQCARFNGLAETINRTQYLVPRMDDEALLRAVRRPAQLFGGFISEALADRLAAQVRGREDELPLLQHGLLLMWDQAARRTGAAGRIVLDGSLVDEAGGLVDLLSAHADRVMDDVAPDPWRRRMVESLFRELTDVNAEGSAIRRPRTLRDLAVVAGVTTDDLRPIVDAFRAPGVSFLTPYGPTPIADQSIIDISHEALIRCWRRIAAGQESWLKREFDDGLAWRSLLSEADAFSKNPARVLSPAATLDRRTLYEARNELWSERYGGGWSIVGRLLDASRKAAAWAHRKSRIALGSMAALFIAASLLAFVAYWQRGQAVAQNEFGRMLLDRLTQHNEACPKGISVDQVLIEKAKDTAERTNGGEAYILGIIYQCGLGVPVNYFAAKEWYEKAAAAGDAVSMHNLGGLYANGKLGQRDFVKAMDWYRRAAAAGDAAAMNNIGALYDNGQGVVQNYALALSWYQQAAAAKDTTAIRNIGYLYGSGHGVERNYTTAMQWYRRAAEANDPVAENNIGALYDNGNGVPQNYGEAMTWYQKAAAAGNETAMRNIGVLFENARGFPRDYGKALEWYQKAAAGGDAPAMRDIGLFYDNGSGVPQDYAKAMDWYTRAASAGDDAGMNNIGALYDSGHGVTQNYARALEWYLKASAAGSATAKRNIGVLYSNGHGVEQNYTTALDWYHKAADAGDALAMNNIGALYDNGTGVPQNDAVALEWYMKAAARGSATAMRNIGYFYSNGRGVSKDYAKAMEWYRKAAEIGDGIAMNNIGALYDDANGVPRDYAKAMDWYLKAAAAGNTTAMRNIGYLNSDGHGIARDYVKAFEWFEKAAAADDAVAMKEIGVLFDEGRGVKQNYAKALEWYQKAAAAGNTTAMQNIGYLYRDGHGVEQNYQTAMSWFQKAAALHDAAAIRLVGELYDNGEGVPQDYAKAMEWYQKAAAAGDSTAMRHIGDLFADGHGVAQDYAKAFAWFQKAVAAGNDTALGSLSWSALFVRDFPLALDAAERAHQIEPDALWTETNRAHALMFLGRTSEALALYMTHVGQPVVANANKPWQQVILEDFAELRKAGLDNPLMRVVEGRFADLVK